MSFKDPGFGNRLASAASAKKSALDKFRCRRSLVSHVLPGSHSQGPMHTGRRREPSPLPAVQVSEGRLTMLVSHRCRRVGAQQASGLQVGPE